MSLYIDRKSDTHTHTFLYAFIKPHKSTKICSPHRCQARKLRRWSRQLPSDLGAGWREEQQGWTGMRGWKLGWHMDSPPVRLPLLCASPEICRPRADCTAVRNRLLVPYFRIRLMFTHTHERRRLMDWCVCVWTSKLFLHQLVRHSVTAGRVCLQHHLQRSHAHTHKHTLPAY